MANIIRFVPPPREPETETEVRPVTLGISMRLTRPRRREPVEEGVVKRAKVIRLNAVYSNAGTKNTYGCIDGDSQYEGQPVARPSMHVDTPSPES